MATRDELYAKFGITAEAAQLFETELGTMLLCARGLEHGWHVEADPDSARKLLDDIDRSTLGRLLGSLRNCVSLDDGLTERFAFALKAQNRLFHGFYELHNFKIQTDEGRDAMIADLDAGMQRREFVRYGREPLRIAEACPQARVRLKCDQRIRGLIGVHKILAHGSALSFSLASFTILICCSRNASSHCASSPQVGMTITPTPLGIFDNIRPDSWSTNTTRFVVVAFPSCLQASSSGMRAFGSCPPFQCFKPFFKFAAFNETADKHEDVRQPRGVLNVQRFGACHAIELRHFPTNIGKGIELRPNATFDGGSVFFFDSCDACACHWVPKSAN